AFVRGTVYSQQFVLETTEGGTNVTYITHSSPEGRIPAGLYNKLLKNQAMTIDRIRQDIVKA
ncbi:hypothetical protein KIPB_002960, partial [Kipferlia bialata]